jgi:hypothetical protein
MHCLLILINGRNLETNKISELKQHNSSQTNKKFTQKDMLSCLGTPTHHGLRSLDVTLDYNFSSVTLTPFEVVKDMPAIMSTLKPGVGFILYLLNR